MSSNDIVFNEDGTFTFNIGCTYNMKGNYKLDYNMIKLSNVKDDNIKNEETIKDIEEKLQFLIKLPLGKIHVL